MVAGRCLAPHRDCLATQRGCLAARSGCLAAHMRCLATQKRTYYNQGGLITTSEGHLQPGMVARRALLGSPQKLLRSPEWLFDGPHALFGNPEEDLLQSGRVNYNQGRLITTSEGHLQPRMVARRALLGSPQGLLGSPQGLFGSSHGLFGNPEEDLLQPGRVNYNQ